MSNLKKIITTSCLTLTLGGFITPVFSNTTTYADTSTDTTKKEEKTNKLRILTENEIKLIDKYIQIKNKRFYLNKNNSISNELYELAQNYINQSNKLLDQYQGKLFVNNNQKKIYGSGLLTRSPGKNDIEFNWNYARIYIDASNVQIGLHSVITVGQAVIPSASIKLALGLLNVAVTQIKDGIWFDYNYFAGGLGGAGAFITANPLLIAAGITNAGFQ